MLSIDEPAYRNEIARAEAQAAQLPEGDPKRAELEQFVAVLRADLVRGYAVGLMRCNGPLGGVQ